MDLQIRINDEELNETQLTLLKDTLGINNDETLEEHVTKLAKASLMEYINMLIEKGLANRVDEVKQDRLYFLIKYYFENRIPKESELSDFFQITNSQSKTLLKNTISRYRTKISGLVKDTLKSVIGNARRNNGKFALIIDSESLKDELNLIVTRKEPTLSQIRKVARSAGYYEIDIDTYNCLREELDL